VKRPHISKPFLTAAELAALYDLLIADVLAGAVRLGLNPANRLKVTADLIAEIRGE
jgi:hypothetical protein